MTDVTAVHEIGRAVTMSARGIELFRYTYVPDTPVFECRCPHFHPLRTLVGEVVTGNRPHDHLWHKGLAMTASHLSGQNFWGGGSYVRDQGYVDLPNVGSLRHRDFVTLGDNRFVEDVDWITADGEHWIDERRTVEVTVAETSWTMDFATGLRNVSGRMLEFGSPTVFGRELAGYCGFFWRGPRSFTGGRVLASDGQEGPEMMGKRAAWLAFVGGHDETARYSTLLFVDHPDNPGHQPYWFVRTDPYPVVNPSLAFYQPTELATGEVMSLRYRLVVADGAWDDTDITKHLAEHTW